MLHTSMSSLIFCMNKEETLITEKKGSFSEKNRNGFSLLTQGDSKSS